MEFFKKLIDFAKKSNKWYIWLLTAVFIVVSILLYVFGLTGCQTVKIGSADSVEVSTSADVVIDTDVPIGFKE